MRAAVKSSSMHQTASTACVFRTRAQHAHCTLVRLAPTRHTSSHAWCVMRAHRCEDIIEGEPAELLVLSQDDTFMAFKV
jgi:hypothetical protein